MDADPDALRTSPTAHESPLDASGDFGPISPELALVDPELARRARALLPEPQAPTRPPVAVATVPAPAEIPVAAKEAPARPERRRRRWIGLRMAVLAVVIFAAGAVSGALFGNDAKSPGSTLEAVRALEPTVAPQPPKPQTPPKPAPLRPPKASGTTHRPTSRAPAPQHRRHARAAWASNVLGVTASVEGAGVALTWRRPADSKRVVVLRSRGGHKSVVVYRGPSTRYHDGSVRACTAYRYTIVNYDRRGHRSTGVPTSVVTRCS